MLVEQKVRYPVRESPFNYMWDDLKNRLIRELRQQKDTSNEGGLIIALWIMVAFEDDHKEEMMQKVVSADEG